MIKLKVASQVLLHVSSCYHLRQKWNPTISCEVGNQGHIYKRYNLARRKFHIMFLAGLLALL